MTSIKENLKTASLYPSVVEIISEVESISGESESTGYDDQRGSHLPRHLEFTIKSAMLN